QIENGTFSYYENVGSTVNESWIPTHTETFWTNNNNINSNIANKCTITPDPFGGDYNYSHLVGKEVYLLCSGSFDSISEHLDTPSFFNVKVDFNRNFSILIITVPLFAIFFLLGAIFIFENSSDGITTRLTLTLGIFALIFTLPGVIDSMKPQASGPTIADSMLSIIIIATISFTISSIVSNSSIVKHWFPKRYSWADGIIFIIVSGFVVSYFIQYVSDAEIWWIIPLIIFGLGYGLLLKVLGVKGSRLQFGIRGIFDRLLRKA
ncbi:MAG TPA: hypothetical protein VF047_05390, partial [Nitrososphaeraceae archaeon]